MTQMKKILVCGGTGCLSAKSDLIVENLKTSLKNHNLNDSVEVIKTGCFGFCAKGPIVVIDP
ncbi:MAG: (2Fe-2S) ferredoxin domain-containing protein, partial [Cetobacterium sp.]